MARQTYLFADTRDDVVGNDVAQRELRLVTWNLQSPSLERAQLQFNWLVRTRANIAVLTEVRGSKGCDHLVSSLEGCGFRVHGVPPKDREYGVLVAVKGVEAHPWDAGLAELAPRVVALKLDCFLGELALLGVYAPSRSPNELETAIARRRAFHDTFASGVAALRERALAPRCIVVGDFNVVERRHVPKQEMFGESDYRFYESFGAVGLEDCFRRVAPSAVEHSWFGATGMRQRIDHAFVSGAVSSKVAGCHYDHSPRHAKLSDHSALVVQIRR